MREGYKQSLFEPNQISFMRGNPSIGPRKRLDITLDDPTNKWKISLTNPKQGGKFIEENGIKMVIVPDRTTVNFNSCLVNLNDTQKIKALDNGDNGGEVVVNGRSFVIPPNKTVELENTNPLLKVTHTRPTI